MSVPEELKLNKAIYKWSIPNFCFGCKKVGEKLTSPVFPIDNTNWLLELYPRGVEENFSQYMSLFLRLQSGQRVAVKFQLSILDANEKHHAIFQREHDYRNKESSVVRGKSDFIKQTEMKRRKDSLVPGGTLTICCEISTVCADEEQQQSDRGCKKSKRSRRDRAAESRCEYEMYFDNEQYSDVKFVTTDNKCIHAHKVVLIGKSVVFANLFSMEIPVLSPDIVHVRDIDYEVLRELMRFVYTGAVSDIEKYVVKLLSAANRFMLVDLKMMCEKYLIDNLSVAMAIDLLFLAEDYDLKDLREEVKHFIALNIGGFIDSPDFQELAKYYPKIVVEIVQLSIE